MPPFSMVPCLLISFRTSSAARTTNGNRWDVAVELLTSGRCSLIWTRQEHDRQDHQHATKLAINSSKNPRRFSFFSAPLIPSRIDCACPLLQWRLAWLPGAPRLEWLLTRCGSRHRISSVGLRGVRACVAVNGGRPR